MELYKSLLFSVSLFLFTTGTYVKEPFPDKPCAARLYPGQSYGCVCNATYCDEIIRQVPNSGQYITYTSSAAGLRLQKSEGQLINCESRSSNYTKSLVLNPEITYQTIEGFGGAVTDSASMIWKNMSMKLQKHLINSYYGANGIGYNMARVPIAGCDFSTRPYAYNELPVDDAKLTNYSLSVEDIKFKIPMLKSIMAAMKDRKDNLEIIASAWTVPLWMKNESDYNVCGHLREEYMQTYADYFKKFIELYSDQNIPIWAITTTNEPIIGFLPFRKGNCLGWYPTTMGDWLANNLGPTIRKMKPEVKILAVDDQRFTIPIWFYGVIKSNTDALQYMDGLAIHYYGDIITPPSLLEDVTRSHPDKFLIYTEACEGSFPWEKDKVILGSWKRAESYMNNIMTDINYNVVGWVDWNLCLDPRGGPNWIDNYVDSPVIFFADKGEFIKQPMFYAMAHVAKFVVRGSKRIKVHEENALPNNVRQFAVLTPENTVVVVLFNGANSTASVSIRLGDRYAELQLPARAFSTLEMRNEYEQSCEMQIQVEVLEGFPVAVEYQDYRNEVIINSEC